MRSTINGFNVIRRSIIMGLFCLGLVCLTPYAGLLSLLAPVLYCGYGQWLCSRTPRIGVWALLSLVAPLGATLLVPGLLRISGLTLDVHWIRISFSLIPFGALFFLIFVLAVARQVDRVLARQALTMLCLYSGLFVGTLIMANESAWQYVSMAFMQYFYFTLLAFSLVMPVSISGLLGRLTRALQQKSPEYASDDPSQLPGGGYISEP